MSSFCPTCQADNCMKVGGVGPPKTFYLDTYGQIGYICRFCGTRGWGPGSSPGLILSCETGPITVRWVDVTYKAISSLGGETGCGPTQLAAVKNLLERQSATGYDPIAEQEIL